MLRFSRSNPKSGPSSASWDFDHIHELRKVTVELHRVFGDAAIVQIAYRAQPLAGFGIDTGDAVVVVFPRVREHDERREHYK